MEAASPGKDVKILSIRSDNVSSKKNGGLGEGLLMGRLASHKPGPLGQGQGELYKNRLSSFPEGSDL